MTMRKLLPLLTSLLIVVVLASGGLAKAQASSSVTIVHGLPRFTADVYVNGELLLSGFKAESTTDPLTLEEGEYDVAIRDVGSAPDSEPALQDLITLNGGINVSIVAHLDEGGNPALSVFENDLSQIPAGESRLVARHNAAAPAVDVLSDGETLLTDLTSGNEADTNLAVATHEVAVALAGGGEEVVSPTALQFEEGTSHVLYLIGSAEDETLDLMVQTVSGLQSAPSGVATGDGGLAETPGFPAWAAVLMIGAAFVLVASSLQLRRSRRSE
ncbi:MAG TPA: DUF4397 domain-containing protein [Actinomycetota bacterium]|nr:DUF4397 domain-containing protein [Actinomycetota bacterium]